MQPQQLPIAERLLNIKNNYNFSMDCLRCQKCDMFYYTYKRQDKSGLCDLCYNSDRQQKLPELILNYDISNKKYNFILAEQQLREHLTLIEETEIENIITLFYLPK